MFGTGTTPVGSDRVNFARKHFSLTDFKSIVHSGNLSTYLTNIQNATVNLGFIVLSKEAFYNCERFVNIDEILFFMDFQSMNVHCRASDGYRDWYCVGHSCLHRHSGTCLHQTVCFVIVYNNLYSSYRRETHQ